MSDQLECTQGIFQLTRCPENKKQGLRAWDAADEYLLNELQEKQLLKDSKKILLINDSFGALATALSAQHSLTLWSDSFLSWQCTAKNLADNQLSDESIKRLKSTETPAGEFDLVLMKIPKSHLYLQDLLQRLSAVLTTNTTLIAAAMAKNIHSSTLAVFEKTLAPTTTSLAKKKARLVYVDTAKVKTKNHDASVKQYLLENSDYQLNNYSNVFSAQKLDIGTRLLLANIPVSSEYKTIVDMGCGNGVVGLISAEKNPVAKVIFTDESFMAVQSATENFKASDLNNDAEFYATDCLQALASGTADLVLNNPPFHQQHAVGTQLAMAMFKDAKRVLKTGGELWVIGNRHLGYHLSLKKIFGNSTLVTSDSKFVILKALKKP